MKSESSVSAIAIAIAIAIATAAATTAATAAALVPEPEPEPDIDALIAQHDQESNADNMYEILERLKDPLGEKDRQKILNWINSQKIPLTKADLAGANLSGANLSGANLSGANLSGANLALANLQDANLSLANLQRANLSGANLKGVNLQAANISGANLEGARFSVIEILKAFVDSDKLVLAKKQTTHSSKFDECQKPLPENGPILAFLKKEDKIQDFIKEMQEKYQIVKARGWSNEDFWNIKAMDSQKKRIAFTIQDQIKNKTLNQKFVMELKEMACTWFD